MPTKTTNKKVLFLNKAIRLFYKYVFHKLFWGAARWANFGAKNKASLPLSSFSLSAVAPGWNITKKIETKNSISRDWRTFIIITRETDRKFRACLIPDSHRTWVVVVVEYNTLPIFVGGVRRRRRSKRERLTFHLLIDCLLLDVALTFSVTERLLLFAVLEKKRDPSSLLLFSFDREIRDRRVATAGGGGGKVERREIGMFVAPKAPRELDPSFSLCCLFLPQRWWCRLPRLLTTLNFANLDGSQRLPQKKIGGGSPKTLIVN